jgi:hypothetical protein
MDTIHVKRAKSKHLLVCGGWVMMVFFPKIREEYNHKGTEAQRKEKR